MTEHSNAGTGEDDRSMGVEFGDLKENLESEEFPMSLEELLEAHGDEEIDRGGEAVALRDVLGPLQDETYESPDEVEQSVLNMVDRDAVGRQRYSDRGGTAIEDDGGQTEEDESF